MNYKETKGFTRVMIIAIPAVMTVLLLLLGVPKQAMALVGDTTPSPALNTDLIPKLQEIIADTKCKLPCFLGLTPGVTPSDQLNDFIRDQLGLDVQDSIITRSGAINYQMGLSFNLGALIANFKGRNNQLTRMDVVLIKSEDWSKDYNPFVVSVLLDLLGKPTEVYIALQGTNPLTNVVTLVYEDQGVMVQYMNAFNGNSSDEPIQICPKLEGAVRVEAWLQSPDASKPVTVYLEPSPDAADVRGANWTLEQMAGIDIDDFMKLFLENSDACFQIPSIRDLSDLGYQIS